MVDTERLRDRIKKAGYSQYRLAEEMQMHCNTMYNKIRNRNEFTLSEVARMCELIGMDDPKEICETFMWKG